MSIVEYLFERDDSFKELREYIQNKKNINSNLQQKVLDDKFKELRERIETLDESLEIQKNSIDHLYEGMELLFSRIENIEKQSKEMKEEYLTANDRLLENINDISFIVDMIVGRVNKLEDKVIRGLHD